LFDRKGGRDPDRDWSVEEVMGIWPGKKEKRTSLARVAWAKLVEER